MSAARRPEEPIPLEEMKRWLEKMANYKVVLKLFCRERPASIAEIDGCANYEADRGTG
jgi:hypothetical protein